MAELLKIKSIIEIVGTPQEHVEKAMGFVLQKLDERKDLKVIKKEVFPTEKMQDRPFWTCFCDLELDVSSSEALLSYCFDFLPSSVEILEPTEFHIPNFKLQTFFNDVLARMHQYEMVTKNEHAKVILLDRELQKLKGPVSQPEKKEKKSKEKKKES